jgi:hypothetical protein
MTAPAAAGRMMSLSGSHDTRLPLAATAGAARYAN